MMSAANPERIFPMQDPQAQAGNFGFAVDNTIGSTEQVILLTMHPGRCQTVFGVCFEVTYKWQ